MCKQGGQQDNRRESIMNTQEQQEPVEQKKVSDEIVENEGQADEKKDVEKREISLKAQRLHPAAMFFNFTKVIKETIFGLGIGLILTFKESVFYFLMFIIIFLILLIVSSVLTWLRFTYRVEDNELRIEQGVFVRKKRYISINRIHKIDLTANVIHRIFGLTKVQIDTASSGGGAEVSLSAVSLADGADLRKALITDKKTVQHDDEKVKETNPTKKITWKRLFIAGSTSGSIGFILIAILAGFSQIEELIPRSIYNSTYTWVVNLGLVFLVVFIIFILLLLWLLGIAGTMIKYGNFTIEKRENELFIKRGLLETKELTIPYDRIQAIGVEQSLIRQPFKFVRVFAIVAGGSFDNLEPFPVLFPIMREKEVEKFLNEYIPGHTISMETKFTPLAKRGRKYFLFSQSILFFLALIPAIYFFPTYSWIVILLIVISLGFGWLQHRDGGYVIAGKQITIRKRKLDKIIITTYHRRIQALEKKQHKLQKRENLATTGVSLIGSGGLGTHYSLKHLKDEDADRIANWYSYRKEKED